MSAQSSPAPIATSQLKDKKKKKDKSSKKQNESQALAVAAEHGRNEGSNPNWAYKPSAGAVLLDHSVESEDFDWDAVKNDEDVELWLIRVPKEVKPKHLENAQIEIPSSPPSRSARLGTLQRKHASYDIWSVGDDDEQPVGGEEIKGLSCLLPRKKKGKLYAAPKPIARHLVISAQPTQPTVDPSSLSQIHQNPPRYSYPKKFLKHRFMPYGSQISKDDQANPAGEDVDMTMDGQDAAQIRAPSSVIIESGSGEGKRAKEGKGKKRKGESDSPKKSKKAKTAA